MTKKSIEIASQTDVGARAASDLDMDDAGRGLENMERDERRIPLMRILQSNSPQVNKHNAKYIAEATVGGFFNTATQQCYAGEPGELFIPVSRHHNFVEFTPREDGGGGGGFVAMWEKNDARVAELRKTQGKFGRLLTADGTEVSEIFYLFGLLVDEYGLASEVIVPFGSTQIKKYQNTMERLNSIRYTVPGRATPVLPALFAHKWRLGTVYEHNKKGEFYGWRLVLEAEPPFKAMLPKSHPLYLQAKEFNRLIEEGQAKPSSENYDAETGEISV